MEKTMETMYSFLTRNNEELIKPCYFNEFIDSLCRLSWTAEEYESLLSKDNYKILQRLTVVDEDILKDSVKQVFFSRGIGFVIKDKEKEIDKFILNLLSRQISWDDIRKDFLKEYEARLRDLKRAKENLGYCC